MSTSGESLEFYVILEIHMRSPWPPRGGTGGIEQQGAIEAWWNLEEAEGGREERRRRDVLGFLAGWHGVAWKDMVGPACGTVARYIWMDPHGGMVASQRVYIFIMKFGK
jgi:hypothetical protein